MFTPLIINNVAVTIISNGVAAVVSQQELGVITPLWSDVRPSSQCRCNIRYAAGRALQLHGIGRIAQRVFDGFTQVENVVITVTKVNPPMGADLKGASVTLFFGREE